MSASGIEHLLLRPERLTQHLSSDQKIEVLDIMINKALQPLVAATDVVQEWICELLPLVTFDSRRKISTVKSPKLINMGFAAIFTESRKLRYKLIKNMKLERGIPFMFFWKLFKVAAPYTEFQRKYCAYSDPNLKSHFAGKMLEIETRVAATSRDTLAPALNTAEWWSSHAKNYKSMIAEKYHKLAYRETLKAAKMTTMHIDTDELFKNYLMALNRAIDKYSPQRGALTSYLMYWFKDANINSDFNHQYGISYSFPNSQKRKLAKNNWINNEGAVQQNIAVNIDEGLEEAETGVIDSYLENNIAKHRLKALSVFPEMKMVMLVNNIAYPLNEEELQIQRDSMLNLDLVK